MAFQRQPITHKLTLAFVPFLAAGMWWLAWHPPADVASAASPSPGVQAITHPGLLSHEAEATSWDQTGVIDVCPSGCPYSSIQQAINASSNGKTLQIGPGTYNESIALRAGVSLIGAGAGSTVIRGAGTQPTVSAGDANIGRSTVIEHLSITGGGGENGAGVLVDNGAAPTLRSLVIYGNSASSLGGGVGVASGGDPLLDSVVVRNNVSLRGSGMALRGKSRATVRNSTFEDNSAADTGGGLFVWGSTVTLDGAAFSNNIARYGGALAMGQSTVSLINSTLKNNRAEQAGGAVYVSDNTQIVVDNCLFLGNRALQWSGGAILSDHNPLEVRHSTFDGNHALFGGAVHLHHAPNALLSNNTIVNGQARDGAGIYIMGSQARLTGNHLSHNAATEFGGAIVVQSGSNVEIDHNQISHNTASLDGGGIVFQSGATGSLTGNIISFNQAGLVGGAMSIWNETGPTLSHNRFEGNRATDGAAIQIELNANPVLMSNEFTGNIASRFGGAIVVNILSAPTIRNNLFVNNQAALSGGAMVVNDRSRALVQHNAITNNTAGVGGGLVVISDDRSQIIDNHFSRNTANDHGGGIYLTGSHARITGNQFANNQSRSLGGAMVIVDGSPHVENNLIAGNLANDGGAGIYLRNSQAALRQNTIVDNGRSLNGDGVLLDMGAHPTLVYNNITGNDYGIRSVGSQPHQTHRNNVFGNRLGNYQGVSPGATDLQINPQFVPGPRGPYYLSQTASGHATTSPLVDACTETAQSLGLDHLTTRTDNEPDQGLADIGFHYQPFPVLGNSTFLPIVDLAR